MCVPPYILWRSLDSLVNSGNTTIGSSATHKLKLKSHLTRNPESIGNPLRTSRCPLLSPGHNSISELITPIVLIWSRLDPPQMLQAQVVSPPQSSSNELGNPLSLNTPLPLPNSPTNLPYLTMNLTQVMAMSLLTVTMQMKRTMTWPYS